MRQGTGTSGQWAVGSGQKTGLTADRIKRTRVADGYTPSARGFTAIEMLVVLLIFSILAAAVFIPAYLHMQNKGQEAQVRSNAQNLQKIVEVFRMNNFKYPSSLADLDLDANERNYNMTLSNPFTGASGTVGSNKWAVKIANENVPLPGFVGYKYIDASHYEIYAYGREGQLIKDVAGKEIYVLKSG